MTTKVRALTNLANNWELEKPLLGSSSFTTLITSLIKRLLFIFDTAYIITI